MLTAIGILCVLVLIAWALVRCYAAWRLWLYRRDERWDYDPLAEPLAPDVEARYRGHTPPRPLPRPTDALSVRAPVATVRDQASQVVPAVSPRVGYDHFVADLPNPDWSWTPKEGRE